MKMNNLSPIYCVILILCLQSVSNERYNNFNEFKDKCQRIYSVEEEAYRKNIFEANDKKVK